MPRFVSLLRGVNVGKGNRVPMAEFKRLLEELGCAEVRTLLNSGNAVFASSARSTDRLAQSIAAELSAKLGVSTLVIVKSAAELARIVRDNPMPPPESEHARFLVAFAQDPAALPPLAALGAHAEAPERLVVTECAAYLSCPSGLLESPLASALLGKAGKGVTTRNWATVLKLAALLGVA